MNSQTQTKPMSARQTAVYVICAVIQQGKSLTDALSLCENLELRERAFCRELCYGTLRWYYRLEAILHLLLKKPFKPKDVDITVLALISLYQIIYLNTPDHAAVSETINLCKKGKKSWAKGVLNGVLRNFLRNRESLESTVDETLNQQYSHPEWLVKQLKKDWGSALLKSLPPTTNIRPCRYGLINAKAHATATWNS